MKDVQGEPFVGRLPWQLLNNNDPAMGPAPREDVYFANVVKCRPAGKPHT